IQQPSGRGPGVRPDPVVAVAEGAGPVGGPRDGVAHGLLGRRPGGAQAGAPAGEAQVEVEHFAATGAELPAMLDAYAGAPFALRGDLLVRVGLFHCDDGDVVCLVAHHLVFDAASAYTLLDTLVALYNHFCHHSAPP